MPIQGPLLGLTVDAHVGDIGQPPDGDFVEMFQGAEGAAVEQAFFDVIERPLHFAFCLAPPDAASSRRKAVVGGEGEELRIVERPFIAVPQHHDLHVVVQASAGHAAQMFEGADVFAQSRRQVLGLDKTQILAAGVTEHIAERVNATAAFAGEVDVVGAVIHLGLGPG